MSTADKIEKLTTQEFEYMWLSAIKDTNLNNRVGILNISWENLQEQVILFLDKWEDENGKS